MSKGINTLPGKIILHLIISCAIAVMLLLSLNFVFNLGIAYDWRTFLGANGLVRLFIFSIRTGTAHLKPKQLTIADYLNEDAPESVTSRR